MGDKPSKTKTSTESPAEVASYASKSQEPQATSKTGRVNVEKGLSLDLSVL